MTTGQKIANCRKKIGLTQEELAKTLGVSRQAVSRWESDLAFPETYHLTELSKLFGVTVDWLLNYDSSSERTEEQGDTVARSFSLKDLHFEYKSKTRLGRLPLVHINIGLGRRAAGVISIGLISTGIISFGLISVGILSFGLLSLGLLSLGILSGGVVSAGVAAIAVLAVGSFTVGCFALGAINCGLYSVGAISYGKYVAIGDIARGGIALGNKSAEGSIFSATFPQFEAMKEEIYLQFDKLPKAFSLFTGWCRSVFNGILNGTIILGGRG